MDPKSQSPIPPVTPEESPSTEPASPAVSSPSGQTPSPAPVDPLTDDVEKELVQHILENIGEDKLSLENAQKLAQEFLTLLPFKDKTDLVQKLNTLGQEHDEVKPIYLKYAAPMEEEARLKKIEEMSAHIKAGNIEHAITVAKGGTVTNGGQ